MASDQVIRDVPSGAGEAFEELVLRVSSPRTTPTSGPVGEGPNILFGGVDLLALRTMAYRVGLSSSLVLENDHALRLLGRLMETRVIERSELGDSIETSEALGWALGAAAQIFDIDEDAIRLLPAGEEMATRWAPESDE